MPTTGQQDKSFAKELEGLLSSKIADAVTDLFNGASYDWVLDWVLSNFDPEDVFSDSILESWATRNGFERE